MDKLKELLLQQDKEADQAAEVDVFADSVDEGLRLAAKGLATDLIHLEYRIIQKGSKGLFGMGRQPYHLRVSVIEEDETYKDIEDLHVKLTGGKAASELETLQVESANANGAYLLRFYRTGVHLKVTPPRGSGIAVEAKDIFERLEKAGLMGYDRSKIEKVVKKGNEELVKVCDFKSSPEKDSVGYVEVSDDQMKAFLTVHPPKPGGCHMRTQEAVRLLKAAGVVYGIKEEDITAALENDSYNTPILAAKGDPVENGADARIDYKVKTEKEIHLKEERGRVDFKKMNLIENVVVGALLAEKVPAQKGKNGRTVTNRVLPSRDGSDTEIKQGKGTILSDDGKRLTAEINGQVILVGDKISVEPVYRITGDVSTETGDVVFLGSVIVTGSVQDNYSIKAAGNIEVFGTVQKANLEAEGDIIIHQGIMGKDGARLESTNGSLSAKFIQQAEVIVEDTVHVSEGIMHSRISAGSSVICDGKRAQIAGGVIQAGQEIRAKQIGSAANPETVVMAGVHPKINNQLKALKELVETSETKMEKVDQNVRTLEMQEKSMRDRFPEDKKEMLIKFRVAHEKLQKRISEASSEMESLEEYMSHMDQNGKIHVEKTLFIGVNITIKKATFPCRQDFNSVSCVEEKGEIKFLPWEKPSEDGKDWRKRRNKDG